MRAGLIASALVLAGAGLGPAYAQGQAGPKLAPSRDATVLYTVQAEGAPTSQPVRVYFSGNGALMRIDGPDGPGGGSRGAMILDRAAKTTTVVLNEAQVYMQIPQKDEVRTPFLLDGTMQFTRAESSTVAGQPCTNWTIVSGKGNATACVTDDGIILSESGVDASGSRGHLQAQTVSYAPLAPSLFVPPIGYKRTEQPPGLGAGLGAGPNAGGPDAGGPNPGGPAMSGSPSAGAPGLPAGQ